MSEEIGISIIADRYAEAMLNIAEENNVLDFVKNDLPAIANTLRENKDFKDFLEHPLIPKSDKKDVLEKLFRDKFNPYVINLIKLLLDRNRIFIFCAISNSFIKQFNKKFNIITAEIITAINIDNDTKNLIQQRLASILSKQVEITTKLDPDIIGGVVIKVEDRIIDGSIKGRIESIQRTIK